MSIHLLRSLPPEFLCYFLSLTNACIHPSVRYGNHRMSDTGNVTFSLFPQQLLQKASWPFESVNSFSFAGRSTHVVTAS